MRRNGTTPRASYAPYPGKRVCILFPAVACRSFMVLAATLFLGAGEVSARMVRVGVYNNPPKVEMGESGAPCGIFIDVIEHIAQREGWEITYVQGTWNEGLARLEKDSIDIMPDVAFSENRNRRFDFTQLAVLSSWLQVFTRKDVFIASVSELEGKTIAVLKGSIQQQVSEEIRERFGLSFNLIELRDYDATISAVESGKADAMIVSRFYGYRREKEGALAPTPIIFHPTALHIAAPKGRNRDLLGAIDKHIAEMMNDPRSAYYQSQAYWLSERPRMFIPWYVLWTMSVIAALFLIFFSLSLALRWQVRKRTDELRKKNEELSVALQALKAAKDDAIKRERLYAFGQLASGIAHDFNNLLIPIMNYSDLMLIDTDGLDDMVRVRQNLAAIKSAARHGAELIQRMQTFYRSARHSETREVLDTNAVLREVIELTKTRWKGRTSSEKSAIEVVFTPGAHAEITGRRSDIHEMLLNLVLNAVDAMPEGGRLEVTTENSGGEVRITVKDNGMGMSGEVREKCLQPFFTTKGEAGTGMGLTMVNNIVTEHGGRLEIISSEGAGARFVITFPSP
ncbi:MAG: transporter substrate-binding domain-containing protein [Chitinispirillaceae bacterium]|nr:transporter substrate-binding domain-containing protein [Chitinispirillaceae bacterium]